MCCVVGVKAGVGFPRWHKGSGADERVVGCGAGKEIKLTSWPEERGFRRSGQKLSFGNLHSPGLCDVGRLSHPPSRKQALPSS